MTTDKFRTSFLFPITTDLGNLRGYIDTTEVKICERHSESYPVYIVFYITVLEKSYKSTR